jgi:5-methylcytosine-specific restriction endonuclease McrA
MPPKRKTSQIEKAAIPRALREQVWLQYAGESYKQKCLVPWCQNMMTVFDFHVGHNIPESHGGKTEITNLRPICSRCNLSMGNEYSITEWSQLSKPTQQQKVPWWVTCCSKISVP